MRIVNEAVHLDHKWIFIAIPKLTTLIRTVGRRYLYPKPTPEYFASRDAMIFFFLKKSSTNRSFPSVEIKTYSQIKMSGKFFLMLLNLHPFETLGKELFPFFRKRVFRSAKFIF